METAVELIQERGYGGCTIDALVERSGVARTTIYRHWPDRTALLAGALGVFADKVPSPGTGALRTDLIELLRQGSRKLEHDPFDRKLQTLPGLVEAARQDPSLIELPAQRTAQLVKFVRNVLDCGKRQGEIDPGRDLDTLANIFVGAVFIQSTFLDKKLSDEYIVRLVDTFLYGAKSGRKRRSRATARTRAKPRRE